MRVFSQINDPPGHHTLRNEQPSEVSGLRGSMLDAANKIPVPERFVITPSVDSPRVIITDTQTGRESKIGLYGLVEVRQLLNDLFG